MPKEVALSSLAPERGAVCFKMKQVFFRKERFVVSKGRLFCLGSIYGNKIALRKVGSWT